MARRDIAFSVVALFVMAGSCLGSTIDHYGNWEVVSCLSHKDGVTAIATWGGIVILKDEGEVIKIGMNDGLPGGEIADILVADSETIYLLISDPSYYVSCSAWDRLFRLDLHPDGFSFTKITPEFALHTLCWPWAIDLGPDGSLWIVGFAGLWVHDGINWTLFSWPDGAKPMVPCGTLCVDGRGRAWIALSFDTGLEREGLCYLEDGEWQIADGISQACAVDEDSSGRIWCVTDDSLWVLEGENWTLASEDPVWWDNFVRRIFPDQEGGIWALAKKGILHWRDGTVDVITEAAGVDLEGTSGWFVSDGTSFSSDSTYFGTAGSGLLILKDGEFTRIRDESCLPSFRIENVLEDSEGRILCMTNNDVLDEAAMIHDGTVNRIHWPYITYSSACNDQTGTLWFVSSTFGPMSYEDGVFNEYGIVPKPSGGCIDWHVSVDQKGSKWFSMSYSMDGALSFDGDSWTRYQGDLFRLGWLKDVVIGPDDVKWFAGDGYLTTFDNEIWRTNNILTYSFDILNFDTDGSLIGAGGHYVRKYSLKTGWIEVLRTDDDDYINALEVDADGHLWCGTSGGLYYQENSEWRKLTGLNGLSRDGVLAIAIDHNGDKWVGSTCLDHIQDGGAAQQKLELAADDSTETELVLTATLKNTGAVIPVLLWLACEYNGSLYYYPDWGPSPAPTDILLGAHSTGTYELLRIETSSLPGGHYTFYGAISLVGGFDCLIGARDKKVSVVSYHKD